MYDRLTELLLVEGDKHHTTARQAARRDHDEKLDPEKGWTRYSSQWSKNSPPGAKLKSYRKTYDKERARLKSQPLKGEILPRPELPPGPEPKKPERPPIEVKPRKPDPSPVPSPVPSPSPKPTTPDPEEPDTNPDPQEKIKKKKNKFKKQQPYSKLVDLVRQAAAVTATKQVY